MDDLDFSIAETRVQKKDKARKGNSGAQSDKREKVKSAKKTSDKGSAKAQSEKGFIEKGPSTQRQKEEAQ